MPCQLSFWVGLISLGVYVLTLSPGVSWAHHSEDSGDLITSAWTLGIPHPTGYPLFCILGFIWSHIIAIGSVAWRMNLFSAMWGALSAAVTVRAVWASFNLLDEKSQAKLSTFTKSIACVSSGLLLAFATDVWSLSIVTEVYSLNLFFTALIGWILIELLIVGKKIETVEDSDILDSIAKRRGKLILLLGLVWGLALCNHLTSLFLFPGILVVWIFSGIHPRPSEIGKGILFFLIALLLYLYLPIRSAMNPPLDWGNPESVGNFIWMVTGQQFRKLMFTLPLFQMLHQIMRYSSIPYELGTIGAIASILGLIKLTVSRTRGATVLFIHTILLTASSFFYLSSYAIWDPEGYLLPMIWATALWAGWAITLLEDVPRKLMSTITVIVVVLLIASPVVSLASHWKEVDLSGTYDAIRYGEESFESFDENALVIEVRYERAFTLWYYREVEYASTRDDVAVVFIEHAGFDWGLNLLRRKYPDLVLPESPILSPKKEADTTTWFIENNIANRPIYCGTIVDSLTDKGYRFEAVGLLFRVYPPSP
ncbi:MAG: DUF2723 domain-containing protein [bacterium]|nr:DUF2723 domain-containing protein [bacterium]